MPKTTENGVADGALPLVEKQPWRAVVLSDVRAIPLRITLGLWSSLWVKTAGQLADLIDAEPRRWHWPLSLSGDEARAVEAAVGELRQGR